jgi:hypothetical protein
LLAIGIAVVVKEHQRAPRLAVRYDGAEPAEQDNISRMDVAAGVRHRVCEGCHGLYDVKHTNFLVPSHGGGDDRGNKASHNDRVAYSPFEQDQQQMIKGGLEKYATGK